MHDFSADRTGLCRECGRSARDRDAPPAGISSSHARRTDPDTSSDAIATINVTAQALRVLRSYASGLELLDAEAYERAGFPEGRAAYQRCSDLRELGYIERTGERRKTPAGRAGYVCRVTPAGRDFLLREALR